MTSLTFKNRLVAVLLSMMTAFSICYAQDAQMGKLIGESLSKLQQDSSAEAFRNCIAELKRVDAMYPDSAVPKYHIALQSLLFSVTNPQAEQTDSLVAEAEQAISQMEEIKDADQSDICTLKGFLYMVRIVQDPAKNGPRYYLDVTDYYEKALKINPDNKLAQQLLQKYLERMRMQ